VDRKHADPCRYEVQSKSAKSQLIQQIKDLEMKGKRLEEEVEYARRKNGRMEKALSSLIQSHQRGDTISQTKQDLPYSSIAQRPVQQHAVRENSSPISKLVNVDLNVQEEGFRTHGAPFRWLGMVVGTGGGVSGSVCLPSITNSATNPCDLKLAVNPKREL